MKNFTTFFTQIAWLSQLGFSLITPLLLSLLICSWLTRHTAVGLWIYFPAFFLGLGGSGMTGWKLYQHIQKKQKPHDQYISFRDHG